MAQVLVRRGTVVARRRIDPSVKRQMASREPVRASSPETRRVDATGPSPGRKDWLAG
jgi:hypothetical protein